MRNVLAAMGVLVFGILLVLIYILNFIVELIKFVCDVLFGVIKMPFDFIKELKEK